MGLRMDNDPKHTAKIVTKLLKNNKVFQSGHHKAKTICVQS